LDKKRPTATGCGPKGLYYKKGVEFYYNLVSLRTDEYYISILLQILIHFCSRSDCKIYKEHAANDGKEPISSEYIPSG
jgi:hypothetical protein